MTDLHPKGLEHLGAVLADDGKPIVSVAYAVTARRYQWLIDGVYHSGVAARAVTAIRTWMLRQSHPRLVAHAERLLDQIKLKEAP